jgi:hypothetical protein
MNILLAIFFVFVFPAAVGWFIHHQTRTKGRFGIGPFKVDCPVCTTPQPFFRKPGSMQELMFGGYTCTHCGCAIDKYGRPRMAE